MFPIIPLFALLAILSGGGTLYWYHRLSAAEKENADRIAGRYALALFGKTLEQLTAAEAHRVHGLTKRHFAA
jgi:hypothetical protein